MRAMISSMVYGEREVDARQVHQRHFHDRGPAAGLPSFSTVTPGQLPTYSCEPVMGVEERRLTAVGVTYQRKLDASGYPAPRPSHDLACVRGDRDGPRGLFACTARREKRLGRARAVWRSPPSQSMLWRGRGVRRRAPALAGAATPAWNPAFEGDGPFSQPLWRRS